MNFRSFPPCSERRQQAFQVRILIIWIGNPDRHQFQEAFLQPRQAVHCSCDHEYPKIAADQHGYQTSGNQKNDHIDED